MNMELFRLINNLANKNIVLDKIMIFFSKDVTYIFMGIVALVFILGIIKGNDNYRKASVSTVIITVINLILSFILGSIYYVDRPFVHNKVNLLVPHVKDASFPSDHATGTMSIALGLGRYNRLIRIILTLLSLIVGFSRVYVGNHYPLDVIGAYIMVFVTNYLYNLLLKNRIEEIYMKVEKLLLNKTGFHKNSGEIY
ncbi:MULTISPECIES: undecaprenyl-diphosphatase [Clostridium]|uniref:undecaprenyl-diphosphatase n=1 Tax=Clostridium TaxID=1485 RepID=UPI0008245209|nr:MULTISPECIES: undecaprenyl-diphosphatase [Clostridium]PJI10494.1 undecaprenyl-diphosphatase [Clostridium sp. CT7]